jgi:hypothetical protein
MMTKVICTECGTTVKYNEKRHVIESIDGRGGYIKEVCCPKCKEYVNVTYKSRKVTNMITKKTSKKLVMTKDIIRILRAVEEERGSGQCDDCGGKTGSIWRREYNETPKSERGHEKWCKLAKIYSKAGLEVQYVKR